MTQRENKAITLTHRTQERELCFLAAILADRTAKLLSIPGDPSERDTIELMAIGRFTHDFRTQHPEVWGLVAENIAMLCPGLIAIADAARADDASSEVLA